MGGKKIKLMVEAIAMLLFLIFSLQLSSSMATSRPLEEKLGFQKQANLFLISLPRGPTAPSGPSCQTHGLTGCPPAGPWR
ncbi:hypothetical protein MA16_Dca020833 [Dendrobium catenatum]|uniref:Uncharacterized protein n=1 Tax=Dendrobium catenatum TaxID=906689 RepID=A0A2I0VYS7_9ASPA|nr:hypothetical protein MA16_Dca020833 [Dendrobium catenatum]